MGAQFLVLLADANRQIQIADYLLTVTYPVVKDPKLLLSVVEHSRRAIEDAMQTLSEDAKKNTPHYQEAQALCNELRLTLQQHKEALTEFARHESLVIANDGFTVLKEINPVALKTNLRVVKQFVAAVYQQGEER